MIEAGDRDEQSTATLSIRFQDVSNDDDYGGSFAERNVYHKRHKDKAFLPYEYADVASGQRAIS